MSARRLVGGRGALLLALAAGSCSVQPPAVGARPARPLAAELAAQHALPGAVVEELMVAVGADPQQTHLRGVLRCGGERAHVHVLMPRHAQRRPFVLCLPILAGGKDLIEVVAADLCRAGFAAGWCERAGSALREPQRAPELDELLQRTVQHDRMLLHWVRAQPDEFDGGRTGLVGISLGGFLGSALLALEPELRAGVLCLSGTDLPRLAVESEEPRAARWRDFRRRVDGLTGDELAREMEDGLTFSTDRFAAAVDPERVLLVHADLDRVVPSRFQDRLWDDLGRPRRMRLHLLGHYSAALALDPILAEVRAFLRQRLGGFPR